MGPIPTSPAHVLVPEAKPARLLLATGFPDLDVQPLVQPHRLSLLLAPPPETYYQLVASATRSGLAVVIDGGNRFDAYDLVAHAARLGIHEDDVLSRFRIARAFTPYQMQALLEETLPRLLDQGAVFALVSGLADQYLDPDTPKREGSVLFQRALRVLAGIAHSTDAPLVATDHGALRNHEFQRLAVSMTDETVRFEPRPQGAYLVQLAKRGTRLLCPPTMRAQRMLTEWEPAITGAV